MLEPGANIGVDLIALGQFFPNTELLAAKANARHVTGWKRARISTTVNTPPLAQFSAVVTILPRHEAVDIDTENDWAFAERIARGSVGP